MQRAAAEHEVARRTRERTLTDDARGVHIRERWHIQNAAADGGDAGVVVRGVGDEPSAAAALRESRRRAEITELHVEGVRARVGASEGQRARAVLQIEAHRAAAGEAQRMQWTRCRRINRAAIESDAEGAVRRRS